MRSSSQSTKSKAMLVQSAKRGSSESKKAVDSGSDEDEVVEKKSDVPVSDRIKEAAMHVLRSSRSLSIKGKDTVPKKAPKDEAPKVIVVEPTVQRTTPASQSSAFQPIKKPVKQAPTTGPTNQSKDSKLSVRDRQRAYDEQVRKMNWKPLAVERPPPEPHPDKDAELMKAAQLEIFFPTNFGIPEETAHFPARRNEPVSEMKSSSISPPVPHKNEHGLRPSSSSAPVSQTVKATLTEPNGVTYVPARRATQPIQMPALLRASMDPNRKSFVKPKAVAEDKPSKAETKKTRTKKSSKGTKPKGKKKAKKQPSTRPSSSERYKDAFAELQMPGYGIDDEDNVNYDDEEINMDEFEFSSNDEEDDHNSMSDSTNSDADLIEVPEIRLSLSERLNHYLGSREVSFVSGATPAVTEDNNHGLRSSYNMNPIAKKAIEQSLAFGLEPAMEVKDTVQKPLNRPPKPVTNAPLTKPFTKPQQKPLVKTAPSVEKEEPVEKLKVPKSTFHYVPEDDSDGMDIMDRLRPRDIHYRPYESDEESTGSLFREDHLKDPEFGVVQTILKKRQAHEEAQRRKQEVEDAKKRKMNDKKNQKTGRNGRYSEDSNDPYRSQTSSSTESMPRSRHNDKKQEIDVEALKEQIKREIQLEQAEANATDEMWDAMIDKYESPSRQLPAAASSSSSRPHRESPSDQHDRRGDAYRLRMEIMDELRKQDELFQYTLELHELQSEMIQQAHPTIILPTKVKEEVPTKAPRDGDVGDAARELLEIANLNLFSTEQTIVESEQLLNLYRSLQEQQIRASQEHLHQQQMATLYNLQTLPILQDIQQNMDMLQHQQEMQKRQLEQQQFMPPVPIPAQYPTKTVHEAAIGTSAPSSPLRQSQQRRSVGQEMDTQTSPQKAPQQRQHPTFPYYHYAYPSNPEEEAIFLGHGPDYEERPTETALLKLQKVEQRQKERMAWLDHVIRMHLSTPREAEEERSKIEDLHRVELEQLRQSLRESREKAVGGATSLRLSGPQDSVRVPSAVNASGSSRYPSYLQARNSYDSVSEEEEVSDRGRSFLRLSPGEEDQDDVRVEEEEEEEAQHIPNYQYEENDEQDDFERRSEVSDDVAKSQHLEESTTPESQKKSSSEGNISNYYSLSEEEEEEDVVLHEEKASDSKDLSESKHSDESDYSMDNFEASKSYVKSAPVGSFGLFQKKPSLLAQSQSMVSEQDFEEENNEETQDYTQEFTQDYAVDEDEDAVDTMYASSRPTLDASVQEEIHIESPKKKPAERDDDIEEVDEIPSEVESDAPEEEEDVVDDEGIAIGKSTQSVVDDDDEYDDDFVTSRSHSRILPVSASDKSQLPPSKPAQQKAFNKSIASETGEYSVGDFEVDGDGEDTYEDTFLSAQESRAAKLPPVVSSKDQQQEDEDEEYTATFDSAPAVTTTLPPKGEDKEEEEEESIAEEPEESLEEEEEEDKYEPDYDEQSKSHPAVVQSANEDDDYDYSFEPAASASASIPPPEIAKPSAAVAALLQESTITETIEEAEEENEEEMEENAYDDDFVTDVSRTSVGTNLPKTTLLPVAAVLPAVEQKEDEENEYEFTEDFEAEEVPVVVKPVEKESPEKPKSETPKDDADDDDEIESVLEEIESEDEIDQEEKEEDEQSQQSKSKDNFTMEGKDEETFDDDFEEASATTTPEKPPVEAAIIVPAIAKEEEEDAGDMDYEDDDFDNEEEEEDTTPVVTATAAVMPPSSEVEKTKTEPAAKVDSSSETEEIIDEVVEEVEDEDFADDFEDDFEDVEQKTGPIVQSPSAGDASAAASLPPASTHNHITTKPAVHAQFVVDEDEDGALILEDEESELSGANLRQRLLRASTRSSESHNAMLAQQLSPLQSSSTTTTQPPSTTPTQQSVAMSPPGVTMVASTSSAQLSQLSSSSSQSSGTGSYNNHHHNNNNAAAGPAAGAAVAVPRIGSSSSMHYDPDAQRWIGGDEVSMAGFSSTSSSSQHSSKQPSPKANDQATSPKQSNNNNSIDRFVNNNDDDDDSVAEEIIDEEEEEDEEDDEKDRIVVESSDESGMFLAEKEDSYIPILRKPSLLLSANNNNTQSTTAQKNPVVPVKPAAKKVFDDDLDAFLDGLDDDDSETMEDIVPEKKAEEAPKEVKESPTKNDEEVEEVVDEEDIYDADDFDEAQPAEDTTNNDKSTPVADDKEALADKIGDMLLTQWLEEAVLATQQLYAPVKDINSINNHDIILPNEANNSSFVLLDESQSFAHSSQDETALNISQNTSAGHIILAQKSQDSNDDSAVFPRNISSNNNNSNNNHVMNASTSVDESQSIILASSILEVEEEDEEDNSNNNNANQSISRDDEDAKFSQHQQQQQLEQNTSQANLTNTSTSILLHTLEQQSPLTTAEDAQRALEQAIVLLNFEQLYQALTENATQPSLPSDYLHKSVFASSPHNHNNHSNNHEPLKEWQKQVHLDRFDAIFRALHRLTNTANNNTNNNNNKNDDGGSSSSLLSYDDDELDPLVVAVFRPLDSPAAMKRFLRHHLQQEIAGFQSPNNPQYLVRLQQHQQAAVSVAVNLSNTNNNTSMSHNNNNNNNMNTSIQSLHSQLSQTLQQATASRPQLRHWDWAIYDHGLLSRVQQQAQAHLQQEIEGVTDALYQRLVAEAVASFNINNI